MKTLFQTRQFLKDVKRMRRRGKDLEKLKVIVRRLAQGEPLDARHRDHPLGGEFKGSRDCHIEPNWVLIDSMTVVNLVLERTGSHADIFE